jgi:DNA-binding GntR family transcriptional regulator
MLRLVGPWNEDNGEQWSPVGSPCYGPRRSVAMTGSQIGYPEHSSRRRTRQPRGPRASQTESATELRLLVELSALRKLAERGFSDRELSAVRALATAGMRSARSGDVIAYLQADVAFHQHLVDLAGDTELSEVGRLVLGAGPAHARGVQEAGQVMAAGAREHHDLVNKLADDMIRAAEDVLRHHIYPGPTAQPASSCGSPVRDPFATEAT